MEVNWVKWQKQAKTVRRFWYLFTLREWTIYVRQQKGTPTQSEEMKVVQQYYEMTVMLMTNS